MKDNQYLVEEIRGHFGEIVSQFEEHYGFLVFRTEPQDLIEVVTYLKESPELKFNFLTDVTAVHYPENKGGEFCTVYHLHSWENRIRVRIKVFLPKENLDIPTLIPLYAGANWMERETFDFFGINFVGHPNLKRILNLEEMDYHPMRKEYALEDPTRQDKIDGLFGR